MNMAVIGINHETATTKTREKVSFSDSKKIETINDLLDLGVKEVIVLSTCNRSEIYIADKEKDLDEKITLVKEIYVDHGGGDEVEKHLFIKKGERAISHLYEVTSGLKSIVLGEDQILGQVKDAHQFARELGGSQKLLNKIFREAITTAKMIKNQLKISEHPLSVSYIGVKFLKEKIGRLQHKKALIIGIGKMGQLALEHLLEEDLEQVFITNRNHDKVKNLNKVDPTVKTILYKDRYDIIKDVDIVITATASPHSIIKSESMTKPEKPLYMLDMALPRDVEEAVGNIEGISLYNVDDLKKISTENELRREAVASQAKKIIEADVADVMQWLKTIKVDPVIQALNNQCQDIQDQTLEYLERKLQLKTRERKIVEKMVGSALKRVLRHPIIHLKEMQDEEKVDDYIEMLNDLFHLNGEI